MRDFFDQMFMKNTIGQWFWAVAFVVGALVALGARLGEAEDAAVRGRRIGDKR